MKKYPYKYFFKLCFYVIINQNNWDERRLNMKHIKIINKSSLKDTLKKPGCKECANSCQSACKTSCTVGNLQCEN